MFSLKCRYVRLEHKEHIVKRLDDLDVQLHVIAYMAGMYVLLHMAHGAWRAPQPMQTARHAADWIWIWIWISHVFKIYVPSDT
mmetsp:Transcript_10027/g.21453  ORF Transcript_10027/g.21453 Transcript_10027/m.21453 type:complete len:83 (+) Transcript_10027:278-526(+)